MMPKIDDIVKESSARTIEELEDALNKSMYEGKFEILLCYDRGQYCGVKVLVKFTDSVSIISPKLGTYKLARGNDRGKRIIIIKGK